MIRPILTVLSLVAASSIANAATLATQFAPTNVGGATWTSFFNVTVINPLGITLTNASVYSAEGATGTVEIYVHALTYSGFESSVGGWTLVSSGAVVGGFGEVSSNITDFTLPAGTYGIAMVNRDYRVGWTTPAASFSDSNLSIQSGSVTGGVFTGTLFTNAGWNGSLTYNVVPEPATTAFLGSAGIGLLLRRRA